MKLTPERIFKAGVFYGFLARTERERFSIFGESDLAKSVVQAISSKESEQFARKHPELAAELNETIAMLFGQKRRKKRK